MGTLNSATWQHLAVLPRSVSEHQLLLTFRHASLHPCHSESTPAILSDFATMHSLQACTHMSPFIIYSSSNNNLTHAKTQNASFLLLLFLKITIFNHTANFHVHRTRRPVLCLGHSLINLLSFTLYIKMALKLLHYMTDCVCVDLQSTYICNVT